MRLFDVVTLDEAKSLILRHFSPVEDAPELVPLSDAVGRLTAQDTISREDVPGFHRSTVDGYAVIAADTFGASETNPVLMNFTGTVAMGEKAGLRLAGGEAIYVPTGGRIPEGADSVVMVEYTERMDADEIILTKSVAPGMNIIRKGEDIRKGAAVIQRGTLIRPQEVGILASLGFAHVLVQRRLRAGIISTGDEILPIESESVEGKVRDVNSHTAYAILRGMGLRPKSYGIIEDDRAGIVKTLKLALEECDVLFISGGSSVGNKDETIAALEELEDSELLFHGIAVKPGKPTICARVGRKPVIGLPGHPVAAFIMCTLLSRSLCRALQEAVMEEEAFLHCEMTENYPSNHGREEILPVRMHRWEGKYLATPIHGKSGLISILGGS